LLIHEHDLLENNPCPFTAAAWLGILVLFESSALKNPSFWETIVQSALKLDSAVHGLHHNIALLAYTKPVVRESLGIHKALQWLLRMANGSGGQVAYELRSLDELCQHLMAEYPSTFVSVLEALIDLAPHISLPAISIFGEALCNLACVTSDSAVQIAGRRLLALLYEGSNSAIFSDTISPASMSTSYSTAAILPQSLMESTLLLWGPLMEQSLRNPSPTFNASRMQGVTSLISALRPLLHESRVSSLFSSCSNLR
jgi:hypothetical protein